MSLRIRQFVIVAEELEKTASELTHVLGTQICYRDPAVAKFGLSNALMAIGDQFLEVVSPVEADTAAGRHLKRFGESGYMLILQTDRLDEDRERVARLGVRVVWDSIRPDISAIHLHPKDIGAAIVSLDQPVDPVSWPWAGDEWESFGAASKAKSITSTEIGAVSVSEMADRWSTVLGAASPVISDDRVCILLDQGQLTFSNNKRDILSGVSIAMTDVAGALCRAGNAGLSVEEQTVTICGTEFTLIEKL